MLQIAAALNFIHQNNIAHKNINLHSVKIESMSFGQVKIKLGDFGNSLEKILITQYKKIKEKDRFIDFISPELEQ
jgi:serine/threonine protein kinase